MTEEEILHTLDNCNDGYYYKFVELGHVYSYLIDTRLNVFSDGNSQWAIVVERLGYNPRASAVHLDLNYYGNCVTAPEQYNGRPQSYYSVFPIDPVSFSETTDEEILKPAAQFWLVRGRRVPLTHSLQQYTDAGITCKQPEPGRVCVDEAARLVVKQNRDLFRATDEELNKPLPEGLKKILVIDEWFHKDFQLQLTPATTDEHLLQSYEANKQITGIGDITFESYKQLIRQQEALTGGWNKDLWDNNRPGSYETWQQIAKAIVHNDATHYRPTLQANTHWANWPDAGSM